MSRQPKWMLSSLCTSLHPSPPSHLAILLAVSFTHALCFPSPPINFMLSFSLSGTHLTSQGSSDRLGKFCYHPFPSYVLNAPPPVFFYFSLSDSLDHLAPAVSLLNSRCAALNDDRRRTRMWLTHKPANTHTHMLSSQRPHHCTNGSVPRLSFSFSIKTIFHA